jgi:hypothetical protein
LPAVCNKDRRRGNAGQHQSVTCGIYLACNALAEESCGFHDKFTASGNARRPGFAFHRHFRQMGGKCLFPVPFVTEW